MTDLPQNPAIAGCAGTSACAASPERRRVLWFQHLHKCAGTLIVKAALASGRVPYYQHRNGNPHDASQRLPLSNYNAKELDAFISKCGANGIDFIATEFDAPDYDALAANDQVDLLTCFRDPLKRYVSNYLFDASSGYTSATTIEDYYLTVPFFSTHNYYTRVFSRVENDRTVIDESHIDKAIHALRLFDCILRSDSPEFPQRLSTLLDFDVASLGKPNQYKGPRWRYLLGALRRGRVRPLYTAFRRSSAVSDRFVQRFRKDNWADYRLLEAIETMPGWQGA